MDTFVLEGLFFEGPYKFGVDKIPSFAGLAVVCTPGGEGYKIMTILQGNDISKEVNESPKIPCWKAHAYHDVIDIFVFKTDMSPEDREKFRLKAIEKRKEHIFCDEMPVVEDDW